MIMFSPADPDDSSPIKRLCKHHDHLKGLCQDYDYMRQVETYRRMTDVTFRCDADKMQKIDFHTTRARRCSTSWKRSTVQSTNWCISTTRRLRAVSTLTVRTSRSSPYSTA